MYRPHLTRIDDEIKGLKEFFTFVNDTTDEVKEDLEESIARIVAQKADLHRELIDMKSRLMRSNGEQAM